MRFRRGFVSRRGSQVRRSLLRLAGCVLLGFPRFGFFREFGDSGGIARSRLDRGLSTQAAPHQQSLIVFQRAGMRLLLRDAQFRKHFDNRVGLDFQLPGQLVDTNFAHTVRF